MAMAPGWLTGMWAAAGRGAAALWPPSGESVGVVGLPVGEGCLDGGWAGPEQRGDGFGVEAATMNVRAPTRPFCPGV
jgi:hypothetical protein